MDGATVVTHNRISASPVISGGVVYVGSDDGTLYALDAVTSKFKWSFQTGGEINSTVAVSGGFVYVTSYDRNLYALDAASGSKRWVFSTGGMVNSSPTLSSGLIFFGSDDGNVYAVDIAGTNSGTTQPAGLSRVRHWYMEVLYSSAATTTTCMRSTPQMAA